MVHLLKHTLHRYCIITICRRGLLTVQVDKAIFWIMPMGEVEEVVKMWSDVRLATSSRLEYRNKDERFGCSLDGCTGKYATGSKQLKGLDLDSLRGAIEVLRKNNVRNLSSCAGCKRRKRARKRSRSRYEVRIVPGCKRRGGPTGCSVVV